jgi:hypothetical protein
MLRSLLRLDSNTGKLFWEERDISLFRDGGKSAEHSMKVWNKRYAGKQALTASHRGLYLCGSINYSNMFAHRVVYALYHGHWPRFTVDHIDGNGINNVPSNLRDVEHAENMKNIRISSRNKSGFTGVSFSKVCRKYEARIQVDGRPMILGYFDKASDASTERTKANAQFGYHNNHGRPAQ